MKIDVLKKERSEIELGDVILGTNGELYLVCEEDDEKYPIKLLHLKSLKIVNAFSSISTLNSRRYVVSVEKIYVENIYKNKDITITIK